MWGFPLREFFGPLRFFQPFGALFFQAKTWFTQMGKTVLVGKPRPWFCGGNDLQKERSAGGFQVYLFVYINYVST